MDKALALLLFFCLAISIRASDPGAPVVSVDGTVVTSSPVIRGDQATISMSTSFSSGSIFYTLDGSEPTGANTRYTGPFTITQTKTLRAIAYSLNFSQSALSGPFEIQIVPTFLLKVTTTGGGSVGLNPTAANARYFSNATVTLTPVPIANWKFMYWTNDIVSTNNPLTIQLTTNLNLTAVFGGRVHLLSGSHGVLSMSPYFEIEDIPYGTQVRVTALPDHGYYFTTWGGDATGYDNPHVFTFTSGSPTFSALFLPLPEGKASLTAYTTGKGGTVRVDRRMTYSPGIQTLPPTNLYNVGEMAVVIAEPNPGFCFTGWSGDASGNENPLAVKAEGIKVIRAFFSPGYLINPVTNNSGGAIIADPPFKLYSPGETVQLLGDPLPGYTFDSFVIGQNVIRTNPATVVANGNITVVARFNAPTPAPIPLWTHPAANPIDAGWVAADDAGNSYVEAFGSLVALGNSGNTRWTNALPIDQDFFRTMDIEDMALDAAGDIALIAGRGGRDTAHTYFRYNSAGGLIGSKQFSSSASYGRVSMTPDGKFFYEIAVQGLGVYNPYIGCVLPDNNFGIGNIIPMNTGGSTMSALLSRPALDYDQNRYFTGRGFSNVVYRSDSAGTIVWAHEIDGDANVPAATPLVLGNSTVYAVGQLGRLWAFDFNGTQKWSVVASDPLQPPTVGADGTLYMGSPTSVKFYAFNPDGTMKWVRTPGGGGYKTPAVGADGTIYVSDIDSLYALDPDGNRLWQYRGVNSSPIISSNILFVTGINGLIALPLNATGPAKSPWPMLDAGPQQSAAMRTVPDEPPSLKFNLANSFFAADGFHLAITNTQGASFTIQGSEDLVNWTGLKTIQAAQTNQVEFLDASAPARRFYRTLQ